MLTSILDAGGHYTGLFTSPALRSEDEHWIIGGKPIPEDLLDRSVREVQNAAAHTEIIPTYFEALTLTAFVAFSKVERPGCSQGVDVAVVEVGMGGRRDATNVVRPVAALVTPIGYDHAQYLGSEIRMIAAEKAGVIHRGAIVLTSNDNPVVLEILRQRAGRFGNRFLHVTEEHDTPLNGAFQRRNAGLAVRAARELGIPEEAIERGVTQTKWRGRLEHVALAGKDIWVDGCHNSHAANAIAPFIATRVPAPRLLVFGIMSDKDVEQVTAALFPLFDAIITTEPYPPRSMPAAQLTRLAHGVPAFAEPDTRRAIERALTSSQRSIVIAGSLYLAGAAIEYLDEKKRGEQGAR